MEHRENLTIQLIRSATIKITIDNLTLLIDPMFAEKNRYPAFPGSVNQHLKNPTVDLPMPIDEIIKDVDAVMISHLHLDHFDEVAQQSLPKEMPIYVQDNQDKKVIQSQGFKNITVLENGLTLNQLTFYKTNGQHGSDEIYAIAPLAEALGDIMGFVIKTESQTVYYVGDTIWRKEVNDALNQHQPDIVILNIGKAKLEGFNDAIIMEEKDVLRVREILPKASIIAVHMDALNHTTLSREGLKDYLYKNKLNDNVFVPNDGEIMVF